MDQPQGKERRKSERRSLSYYLPLVDTRTDAIIGHLVDISSIGIMIDCKRNIPSGQEYELQLRLMGGESIRDTIEFTARCKWCRSDRIQPYLYNAGFEIIRVSPENLELIKEIAEKYGEVVDD